MSSSGWWGRSEGRLPPEGKGTKAGGQEGWERCMAVKRGLPAQTVVRNYQMPAPAVVAAV